VAPPWHYPPAPGTGTHPTDPRAAVGAPERSVTDLLWTRADELPDAQAITGLLGTVVQNGNLDQAKATAWGVVRTIDYWLWGLGNGFTVDPVRCQRIASALAPLDAHGSHP
jgi:streptomycin 6-kinase